MTNYVIYRNGSNRANQSMVDRMPLCIETAPDRATACEQAAQRFTVYSNQYLTAKAESRASGADWNSAVENEAMESANYVD